MQTKKLAIVLTIILIVLFSWYLLERNKEKKLDECLSRVNGRAYFGSVGVEAKKNDVDTCFKRYQ